jgi:hypothetical protein
MTDRGLPIADASLACPFVAFDDDRDARSNEPDRRHRCYAEVRPAPRAAAHQEAFCLSAAFGSCPTFQDWARRESARVRFAVPAEERRAVPPLPATAEPTPAPPHLGEPVPEAEPDAVEPRYMPTSDFGDEGVTRRSSDRRRWAAPPPWVTGKPASEPPADAGDLREPEAPAFLAGRPRPAPTVRPATAGSPVRRAPTPEEAGNDEADEDEWADEDGGRPSAPRRARGRGLPGLDRRPKAGGRPRRETHAVAAPSWERPRRFEAYPTIKTRIGLPSIPRLGLAVVALAVAAAALFVIPPILLDVGEEPGAVVSASPSPSAGASPSDEPTPTPAATPQIYVVASGDTMTKIAKKFGIPLDVLIAANRDRIKDPDKLAVGDELVIPTPLPSEIVDPGVIEEPSPSP